MIPLLSLLYKSRLSFAQTRHSARGFTLIELLVAMIISSLVIGSLMMFMMNILETDYREQAKSTSEQELQTALDYIARDLEQAIYIYDADALTKDHNATTPTNSGIKNQIPPGAPAPGCGDNANISCTPILSFWKRELKPGKIPVQVKENGTVKETQYDDGFAYSLVTYFRISGGTGWSQSNRIGRFQIEGNVKDYEGTEVRSADPGFQLFDLSQPGSLQQKMNLWKKATTTGGAEIAYDKPVDILADFIDQFSVNVIPNTNNNSVEVRLRGNALARLQNQKGATFSAAQSAYFPTASMQVKGRGLIGDR